MNYCAHHRCVRMTWHSLKPSFLKRHDSVGADLEGWCLDYKNAGRRYTDKICAVLILRYHHRVSLALILLTNSVYQRNRID